MFQRRIAAAASALGATAFPTTGRFPEVEHGGLRGCYGRCEQNFKLLASLIISKRTNAEVQCARGNPNCEKLKAEAEQLAREAFGLLRDCVASCQAQFPISIFPPIDPAVVANDIFNKYIPTVDT